MNKPDYINQVNDLMSKGDFKRLHLNSNPIENFPRNFPIDP